MCLIFDSFKSRADAEAFAQDVNGQFNLRTDIYDDQDIMDQEWQRAREGGRASGRLVDIFPFCLSGPIVLVDRADLDLERAVEEHVEAYSGVFAGT